MREIKFRGKRIDNGEWVYGCIHFNYEYTKCHIHPRGERLMSFDVIPETVGQHIGPKNKNGKEIYDGDILRDRNTSYHVAWDDYRFCFTIQGVPDGFEHGVAITVKPQLEECEIIGNIHETQNY